MANEDFDNEDFDHAVIALAERDGVAAVLAIPGVWEEVSEYYNNDALDMLAGRADAEPAPKDPRFKASEIAHGLRRMRPADSAPRTVKRQWDSTVAFLSEYLENLAGAEFDHAEFRRIADGRR